MLQFLNLFFFVFHTGWTLFNVFGWIFPKLRKWNLATLLLTAFSWFGLGIWYGWGYCLCTDWHWDVRRQLGFYDQSNSYIHFLILELTGADFPRKLVDCGTVAVFLLSLVLSGWLNYRDWRQEKSKGS